MTADLSQKVIKAFDDVNGLHPGFRPAHAKGILVAGTFTPGPDARSLTSAPHVARASTPVTVRFSDFAGVPTVPDNSPEASPRGIGVRFHLAEHVHTDIVAHSVDGFPARTAEEFVEFLEAVAGSGPGAPKPSPVEVFLGSHPAALKFVTTPKPFPVSFATESFFSVSAYRFKNANGETRFGRYRIVPEGGPEHLTGEAASLKNADYLFDEIRARLASGPVNFRIKIQLAEAGDVVDDATIQWPEYRTEITLGTMSLSSVVANNEVEQRHIIFDPIPRVEGIEPSADPLLSPRADVYLAAGRRRRKGEDYAGRAVTA